MENYILIKILTLTFIAFGLSLALTPALTGFLFKYKLGKNIRSDGSTPVYTEMHKKKAGTPTMGGILIWGTTLVLILLFWFLGEYLNISYFQYLNFLTRKETLLPIGALVGASLVGLLDDFLDVRRLGHKGQGIRFRHKFWLYALVAVIGAWWFYFRLEFSYIHIPFAGNYDIGLFFIPFFILSVVGVSFAVDLTDGLDGLVGGTLLVAFFCFGLIAFLQGKYDLATLIGVVCGSLIAFLWFNIFPARFFMGDTGSMGLGVLLAIVAFLTNTVLLLFFFGFIFMLESITTLLQIFSKKVFKKKVFISTPIHHHFEAIGWPETKVTMRFWIISGIMGIFGIIIYLLDKYHV